MFSELNERSSFPWQVSSQAASPLLNGTGLQAGHSYGCRLVGYEWDRVFANGATPANLQVLGTSSTIIDDGNRADASDTTYYIAPSGAMVFATGSIDWTTALDNYRSNTNNLCYFQDPVVPGMQKNNVHALGGGNGRRNVARFHRGQLPAQFGQQRCGIDPTQVAATVAPRRANSSAVCSAMNFDLL